MSQSVFALASLIDVAIELLEHASEFSAEFSDLVASLGRDFDRQVVRASDAAKLAAQDTQRRDDRTVQRNHDQECERHTLNEEPEQTQLVDVRGALRDLSR